MTTDFIDLIQNSINEYHNKNSCVPDWAIDDIIYDHFDSIPEDEEILVLNNPSVKGTFLIEFDPDFDYEADTDELPYTITRVYDSDDDHNTDDMLIEVLERSHEPTYSY